MFTLLVSARADGIVTDAGSGGLEDKLNATAGLITFATNGTYQLTNWVVKTNTMIDGTGYKVTITGNDISRMFYISSNITLTLTNLTLQDGKTNQGAAIYNSGGMLICSNVIFTGNSATNKPGANGTAGSGGHIGGGTGANGGAGYGGAIYNNQGPMIFAYCTFSNNLAAGGNGGNGGNGFNGLGGDGGDGGAGGPASGGAIYNNGIKAITKMIGCFFANNTSLAGSGGLGGAGGGGSIPGSTGSGGSGSIGLGGAIYNSVSATVNITNTTFANNYAYGGNTAPQGFTFSGTSANGQNGGSAYGGAIDSVGFLNLENCTLFANQCIGGSGGDILHDTAATAGSGGNVGGAGIANTGIFASKNCTIATNDAVAGTNGVNQVNSAKNGAMGLTQGGNLYRGGTTSRSSLTNSILQHGIGPDNYGTVVDGGFNISSDTSCAFLAASTSLSKTNASLTNGLVLFTNQSVTLPVLPINPGSVAQDFITNNSAPAFDERGARRDPSISYPDAGAFEIDPTAPIITTQPNDLALAIDKAGIFRVVAVGARPLAFQWYSNGVAIPPEVGGTNAVLTVTNHSDGRDLGSYFVTVTNSLGSTNSRTVTLETASPLTNLTVITQPASLLKLGVGSDVEFQATVSGPAPVFQWYFNKQPLVDTDDPNATNGIVSGSQTGDLSISSISSSNAGSYYVVVSNSISKLTSTNILLTVVDPGITLQPVSQTVNEGATVTFSSGASGSSTNFTYIWKHTHGAVTNVVGTNGPAYTILSASTNDAGGYFAVVTNSNGSATSTTATLTINFARSQISGFIYMGSTGVSNVTIFLDNGGRMITGSDGSFSQGHFGKGTNILAPDQTFMTILPTNYPVYTDGTNSVSGVIFQAYPTIKATTSAPTNDTLSFLIGGEQNQTLKVQYSTLLTSNSWLDATNVVTTSTNTATLVITNVSSFPQLFLRVTTP